MIIICRKRLIDSRRVSLNRVRIQEIFFCSEVKLLGVFCNAQSLGVTMIMWL